jgi:NAD(P)-dependent dehydrogenase (short-subunit alcohol dehydrogenase family)
MNRPEGHLTPQIDLDAIDRLFDIRGLRVFLPGGYGALGEAIALAMTRHGAHVAIAGPSAAKAEALAHRLRAPGIGSYGFELDARSPAAIAAVTDRAAEAMGGIDVLVNCVGIQREQRLMDVDEATFDNVYEINLKSAMFLGQAVARHQIVQGTGGRQIHLLSVRSQLALRNRGYSAYCATKGGLVMLVKQHAMELAEHNITVNGVAPTFIQSERIRPHLEREGFRDFILDRNPLGRIGDPVEVVGQVRSARWFAPDDLRGRSATARAGCRWATPRGLGRQADDRHPQHLVRRPALPRPFQGPRGGREAGHLPGRRLSHRTAGALPVGEQRQADHHALSQPARDGGGGADPLASVDGAVLMGGCDKTTPGLADGRDLRPACR